MDMFLYWKSMLFYAIVLCILPHDIKTSPPTIHLEKDSGLLWNALRISKTLFEKCSKESGVTWRSPLGYYDVADLIRECFLRRSLLVLDRLRAIDHLQICRGVDLVRYRNDSEADVSRRSEKNYRRALIENRISPWNQVVDKLDLLLETRILKIQMKTSDLPLEEGRRRHHHHMYPLMIFGTLAVIMIAIPMGFQFLAVLGGKALLLAKLALILTSIQGLKKIATSNLNYGLYHSGAANPCKGYHTLDCPKFGDNYEFTVQNDQVQFSLSFEDLVPNEGHYDRSWLYNSKDDQQGYPEGDVRPPGLEPFRLVVPRDDRIE